MKAFILQTSPIWQDVQGNIALMDDFIVRTEAIKSDLILLPEMWASGFSVAEPIYDQQAQKWMQDAAQ
ncbi:MAG: nitrilase family protein, partial [Alloprevotella tannerae]|nr:nitrilase family protein [Alloprevotella tannerae]